MEYSIRQYAKNDFLSIAALSEDEWKKSIIQFSSFLLKMSENNIEKCYVAELNGEVIGFIYGFALPNKTLIPEFSYVKPLYRKYGIASQLLKKLEDESGCSLSMIFYNKTLHDHYAKQGYETGENLETAIKNLPQNGGVKD